MAANTLVLDANQKRLELLELWNDVFFVCRSLVNAAKKEPTKISASMLKEIISMLRQSSGVIDLMEHAQRVEEEEEISPDELEMLEAFEQMDQQLEREKDMEHADQNSLSQSSPTETPCTKGFAVDEYYGMSPRER